MTETVRQFIERVDRLEARYKGDKYATTFQMPRDEMIALRDELELREFLGHFIAFAKEQINYESTTSNNRFNRGV